MESSSDRCIRLGWQNPAHYICQTSNRSPMADTAVSADVWNRHEQLLKKPGNLTCLWYHPPVLFFFPIIVLIFPSIVDKWLHEFSMRLCSCRNGEMCLCLISLQAFGFYSSLTLLCLFVRLSQSVSYLICCCCTCAVIFQSLKSPSCCTSSFMVKPPPFPTPSRRCASAVT